MVAHGVGWLRVSEGRHTKKKEREREREKNTQL